MVLDELNQELTGLINRHGGRAVGLNGQDGRFIHARPLARDADDVDAGFVGDIAGVDVELVNLLLSRNFVPVVLPIGVGDDGAAYHVNSDELAGALARALGAEKLILMTNVAGVPDRNGKLAYILTAREAQTLLDERRVQDDLIPRVTAAVQGGARRRAVGAHHRRRRAERADARSADRGWRRHGRAIRCGTAFPRGQPRVPDGRRRDRLIAGEGLARIAPLLRARRFPGAVEKRSSSIPETYVRASPWNRSVGRFVLTPGTRLIITLIKRP